MVRFGSSWSDFDRNTDIWFRDAHALIKYSIRWSAMVHKMWQFTIYQILTDVRKYFAMFTDSSTVFFRYLLLIGKVSVFKAAHAPMMWLFLFLERRRGSEVTAWNSIKLCHMFGSGPDFFGRPKCGVPSPKTWGPKTAHFGWFYYIATLARKSWEQNSLNKRKGYEMRSVPYILPKFGELWPCVTLTVCMARGA